MTTTQLITELEKPRKNYPQGVLTWESGDKAVDTSGSKYLVEVYDERDETLMLFGMNHCVIANYYTHSADDPRLLGRVLRELDRNAMFHFLNIVGIAVSGQPTNVKTVDDDTLLEAALKALLAKVEGEEK